MELIDILLIVIASLWSILIMMVVFTNLRKSSIITVPLQLTGDVLNSMANLILVFTIWNNILFHFGLPESSWILMGISLILILIWMYISRIQRKYIKKQLEEIEKKLEKDIDKKVFTRSTIIKTKK
jgi:hypothetical protein